MLWIDPEIYTFKDLLSVYPKATIIDSEKSRVVTFDEIEKMAQEEHGRSPLVEDIRWDRIYLRDEDGDIIPLSAAELMLDKENAKLSEKAYEYESQVKEFQREQELYKYLWFLHRKFVAGFAVGLLTYAIWEKWF